MNLERDTAQLTDKFGLDKKFGYGNYKLHDDITGTTIEIYVTLAWIAYIRYGNDRFVIGYLKSDEKKLALSIPQSLDTDEVDAIRPVEYDGESIIPVLKCLNLVPKSDLIDFGSASYRIEMTIYTPQMTTNFRFSSGDGQDQSITNLWQAILATCHDIVKLSDNVHLTKFARKLI